MKESKIHFSQPELELVCNADVILTKNIIFQKMRLLLEDVSNEMVDSSISYQSHSEQLSVFNVSPKISKGENYLGLPYLILDYPRNFLHDNIFAVRSFFWWGNFFSSTLHLAGSYRTEFLERIVESYERLVQQEYFINNNIDPWQHHFQDDNVIAIKNISLVDFEKICNKNQHLKISYKWPLSEWESAKQKFMESWKFYLNIVLN